MSRKQSTSKQSQKSRAELRRDLARNIAEIFRNPETPTSLYNDLANGVLDLFNATPTKRLDQSEEYTLAILNEYAAAQEKGEGR